MADVNGASKPVQLPSPRSSSQAAPSAPSPTTSTQQQTTQSQSQSQQQTSQSQATAGTPPAGQPATVAAADSDSQQQNPQPPNQASTSLTDPGTATRPRDARTIHVLLASLGVSAYQERVPLQLLDFAYRYTASVLSDAQHLAGEGYVAGAATTSGKNSGGAAAAQQGEITLPALRLATASRLGHQFSSQLPKETLLEIAAERNRIRLPDVSKDGVVFGVRLPHERFVMTGTGWGLQEEWDSEVEVDEPETGEGDGVNGDGAARAENEGGEEEEQDEDAEMRDREGFEDVFGGGDRDAKEDEGMDEG